MFITFLPGYFQITLTIKFEMCISSTGSAIKLCSWMLIKKGLRLVFMQAEKEHQLSGKWDEEYIFMVHLKFIPF